MPRQSFPPAALRGERVDVESLALPVIEGSLPKGLTGHWFIVAAVGAPAQPRIPSPRTTPFLNGEGTIYRLDLRPDGVFATTATVRSRSFRADLLASSKARYRTIRFRNMGISRANPFALGTRDQSNTALVPWFRPGDGVPPILACYDAGRPHVIHPATLETWGPVSPWSTWEPQMSRDRLCPMVMSGAHPATDAATGELFVANFSRDRKDFLGPILRLLGRFGPGLGERALQEAPPWIDEPISRPPASFDPYEAEAELRRAGGHFDFDTGEVVLPGGDEGVRSLWSGLRYLFGEVLRVLRALVDIVAHEPRRCLHLHRHHRDTIDRYRIEVDGKPVRIQGSVHQIGVTRQYVVMADTSFKFELDFMVSSDAGNHVGIRRWLRDRLSSRQPQSTPLYLVPRIELVPTDGATVAVEALPVVLDAGTVHWFAQHDDADGVKLLCVHSDGMDPAEFLDDTDYDAITRKRVAPELYGAFCGPTDTSPIRVHTIEVRGEARVSASSELCREWGVGLGSATYGPRGESGTIGKTWWCASGLVPGLVSLRARRLYFHPSVPRKVTEAEWVRAMATGSPSRIFGIDASTGVLDAWDAPMGWTLSTPQHVPADDGPGWLLCTAFCASEPLRSVLVFAADAVARGPLARLDARALQWPFTLHSTWIPEISGILEDKPDREPYPDEGGLIGELIRELEQG